MPNDPRAIGRTYVWLGLGVMAIVFVMVLGLSGLWSLAATYFQALPTAAPFPTSPTFPTVGPFPTGAPFPTFAP